MPLLPVIIAITSIIVMISPALSSLYIYDRELVLSGEVWRLITCHLVHFSSSHLFYNLCGLLLPSWYAWRSGYRKVDIVILSAALAISGSSILFEPNMARYGGLSGIANALIVFVACRGMSDRSGKIWWFMLLTVCCGNTLYEVVTARTSLASVADTPFVPATNVHVVGALAGAAVAWLQTHTGYSNWRKHMGIEPTGEISHPPHRF